MKLLEPEGHGPILVLTEYDIHDIFCAARSVIFEQANCTEETREAMAEWIGCWEAIKVEPEKEEFTPELVAKWEQLLNQVLELLARGDNEIHEDAEYTC